MARALAFRRTTLLILSQTDSNTAEDHSVIGCSRRKLGASDVSEIHGRGVALHFRQVHPRRRWPAHQRLQRRCRRNALPVAIILCAVIAALSESQLAFQSIVAAVNMNASL